MYCVLLALTYNTNFVFISLKVAIGSRVRFLEIAKSNSDRNIETLGMLGGKLAQNK